MSLTKVHLKVTEILLDPNNPRFADVSDDSLNVPEGRFIDKEVQDDAFKKMMHPKFDVITLAKSIETVGFIPVDNIVVKLVEGTNSYVVVEGNRRVTALQYLIREYKKGQSILTKEAVDLIAEIDVLQVNDTLANSEYFGMVIQGIRNVSGIKEWDAFQKAQFINNMIEKGKDPHTISKMLGMQVKEVNRYYKTYCVMNQFKQDEEYGSYFKNSFFSHFDEILKKPVLRTFFGWNDDSYKFENLTNIRRFYEWMLPDEEGNVTFSDARDVRLLSDFTSEQTALNYLDDKNFQKAVNYIENKNFNKVVSFDECMSKIRLAIEAFKNILGEGYENLLTDDDVIYLENSISEMNGKLAKIKKLKVSE